jgi:phage shock protein C
MAKKLYRNESEKVLGGVCAGLGDFLGIDPVFVRIFFILWTVLGELSVLVYILMWIIIPQRNAVDADESFEINDVGARFNQMGREIHDITRQPSSELITFVGIGLIAWGVYHLIRRALPYMNIWSYSQYLWPVLLIAAGGFVIYRATRRDR